MRNKLHTKKYSIIGMLVLFLSVLLVVGGLMQFRMKNLLQSYMEKQVAEQAWVMAELVKERFESDLSNLATIAGYVQEKWSEAENSLDMFNVQDSRVEMGMLNLNGNAVYGEPLHFSDYSGIQKSFRGNPTVSYKDGEGLLFTVPVYNGGNVKYVLYRFYPENMLVEKFGMDCYDGKGRVLLMNYEEELVIPFLDWIEADEALLKGPDITKAFETIREKMNISTAAAAFCESQSQYLFASEVDGQEFLVLGIVAENVVSEGLSYIIALVLWVLGLLLLLLAIGLVFMFGAEEKARESDELRRAKIMADEANRAKSDFLANMSHEIRTPINAVMGMNEMILRECESENIKEYAFNIQNASQNLLALINDILDFSKIEAGKMEIVEGDYSFSALLNDVVNMIQIKANQKKLAFEVQVDEHIPDGLWGDGVRIRQVFVNILNNAVKYTKVGTVTFLVSQEPIEDADYVMLKVQVKDTGIGIREEDMKKLFHDFERLDMKENRNVEGTGLGLAITHKLVEAMHGRLEVESVYGQGSQFSVYLPQKVVDFEQIGDFEKRFQDYMHSLNTYKESFVAPKAKVLVVDDNKMNLFVVENLLKKTQVNIVSCLSGAECLENVAEEHFDVILLDHMMPEMDGIETLKKMKQLEENLCKETPVIALTANAILGVREMYIEEGFDDYLSKPIDGEQLEALLMKYIPEEKLLPAARESEVKKEAASGRPVQNEAEVPEAEPLLNVAIGMKYSAESVELYREFVTMFCSMKEEKKASVEECYATEDWANYAILVHALKSNSLSIGAKKMSERMAQLEQAAKKQETEFIYSHHEEAMQLYEATVEAGYAYLNQNKE